MLKKMIVGGAALALGGAIVSAGPASAHHSYAMFDRQSVQTLSGTVVSWQWTNPHCFVELMVEGQQYDLESASPSMLARSGINRNSLKVGDKVVAQMHPRRDKGFGGELVEVKTADGKTLAFEAAHNAVTQ